MLHVWGQHRETLYATISWALQHTNHIAAGFAVAVVVVVVERFMAVGLGVAKTGDTLNVGERIAGCKLYFSEIFIGRLLFLEKIRGPLRFFAEKTTRRQFSSGVSKPLKM